MIIKRNLEQQVLKNQSDIEVIKLLTMNKINISGVADNLEDVTEPIVGAFYLVKNEQNTYDLYIYTNEKKFINLGEFPKSGPQGLTGIQGQKGDPGTSTRWYSGVSFPANINDGDMYLNTSSYEVYMYSGSNWIPQTNIKGNAGRDGQNGNSIIAIEQQRQGNKSVVTIKTSKGGDTIFDVYDGAPGAGFHVAETLTLAEPLPNNIIDYLAEHYPVNDYDYSEAILVKCVYLEDGQTTQKSYIFVLVDSQGSKVWDNAGQIEGIQGLKGDPGDRIINTENIIKQEAGSQYPNTYKLYINSLPYMSAAPVSDYIHADSSVKLVILPKSLETSTARKQGYIYLFYEE